jgi:hypothetical protein
MHTPTPTRRRPAPDPAAAWAHAERNLDQARQAIDGTGLSGLSGRSALLLSPLARQAQHRDPAVHAALVAEGRVLLTGLLTGTGDTPAEAVAKVAHLEAAHRLWLATQEAPR